MTPAEAARQRLCDAAAQLQGVRSRLLALHNELLPAEPDSPADLDPETEPAEVDRIRTAIGCGLHDRLEPLILDLFAAAAPPREGMGASRAPHEEPDDSRHLGADSDALRRALLARVVADHFTSLPDPETGEMVEPPPYTPEQAQIEVFPIHGRWFAAWRTLEEPEDRPESARWELLLLERNPSRPGSLIYTVI